MPVASTELGLDVFRISVLDLAHRDLLMQDWALFFSQRQRGASPLKGHSRVHPPLEQTLFAEVINLVCTNGHRSCFDSTIDGVHPHILVPVGAFFDYAVEADVVWDCAHVDGALLEVLVAGLLAKGR